MNGIIRNTLRPLAIKNIFSSVSGTRNINNQLRMLWKASQQSHITPIASAKLFKHRSGFCNCGCCRSAHTKAEKELVEFLAEEIVAEKKAQKLKTIPTEVDGFTVSLNGAEVTLEKKEGNETITISFNINHTVDSEDDSSDVDLNSENPEIGEMKSKPTFTVDIKKENQTLGFTCSFNSEPGASGANETYNDIFGIDEITLYTGEHNDNVYAVGGQVLDGCLYDLLMNVLEEKGISNEFAEKLIDLSTNYEHSAYISLLEGLAKFTSGK